MSTLTFKLLVALLILVSISFVCLGLLMVNRKIRQHRNKQLLPTHNKGLEPSQMSQHRRSSSISIRTTHGLMAGQGAQYQEKLSPFDTTGVRRSSQPLPEIHIHLPEEVDEKGQQAPGKVVVVKIDETNIGLEPDHEDLPPYRERPLSRHR